jgi:transcriptional regulator GlxA family with amidase domain
MRDGGQAQYLEPPVPASDGDDLLGPTLAWAIEHLDESLSVELLARRTGLSPRHFARRFKEQQGTTPRQWLLAQRVILARRLLETTDEPVDRIAQRCGFFAATGLRPHFRRLVRCSPSSYRRSFRGR